MSGVKVRIKTLCADRGVSAKQLGAEIGLGAVEMSFVTNGKVIPTRETLDAMCKVLNCSIGDLYDVSELAYVEGSASGISKAEFQSTPQPGATNKSKSISGKHAQDTERFSIWLPKGIRSHLAEVTSERGYRNVTEWFLDMYRQTTNQSIRVESVLAEDVGKALAQSLEKAFSGTPGT